MNRLLQLAFVLCLSACGASAQDPAIAKLRALFPQADSDHNGSLSPLERTRAVELVQKVYGAQWARQVDDLFARAAAPDQSVSADHWRQQVDTFTKPPLLQTERVAMRDGIHLATDIHRPPGTGPFPVILSRTPYSRVKAAKQADGFTRSGYVFVLQDMRGRFDSEGENLPFVGCGWGEHQDGVDTIAWLKEQPWCNGRIGTIGVSAGGITQNLLACAHPEGLVAQSITVAAASFYTDASYIGGAFRKADVENWLTGNKFAAQALEITHAHPSYDDYWRLLDTTTKFEVMNVPAVHIGGWFDMFAQGTINEFVGRQHQGGPGSRGAQKLVMGPWHHAIGKMPAGELTFPGANGVPEVYRSERLFDHYLRGVDNGFEKAPAVAYYVMGDTSTPGAPGNEWRYANDWPVPAQETPLYLTGTKELSFTAPSATDAFLEYTFDPANPCPTTGGNNLTIDRGPMDQRKIEARPDAVVFTSAPLEHPLEITGRIIAKVFLSSSAVDTDLSVRLCDVYPDGRSMLIAEGIQRLRYRHSREVPEPLTPGNIEEVTVDCWSTSLIYNTGHRLRVTITSSNYPRFDINPGTGAAWSDGGAKVPQTNRIFCYAAHPSRLLAPVVAPAAGQ
jgi:predicted acyl esterase